MIDSESVLIIIFAYFVLLMGTMYIMDSLEPKDLDADDYVDTHMIWAVIGISAIFLAVIWLWGKLV